MIACTEPGCTGTYEDGYCNVCGSPQAATAGRRTRLRDVAARHRGRPGEPRPRRGGRRPRRRAVHPHRPHQLEPAGDGRARVGPDRGDRRLAAHPSRRHVLDPAARCAAGRRPHHRAGRAGPGPAAGGHGRRRGARAQAVLPGVRRRGRPVARRACPAGPRASARSAATAFDFTPTLQPGRRRGRPVRGRRLPRARRPRLDLPGARPQRLGPLGGAQGPAQLRRPGRVRGGDLRAAVPRRGRAPADRRDLQLRDARGRRLHRHGVRRRPVAQADPAGPPRRGRRRERPAAGGPGARVRPRDPARVRLPARRRACCSATSSRTT